MAEDLKTGTAEPKELVVASVELEGICPRCAHTLVVIPLKLGDAKVVMRSCSACDTRWWQEGDETLPLGQVLRAMRDNPPPSQRRGHRDAAHLRPKAVTST